MLWQLMEPYSCEMSSAMGRSGSGAKVLHNSWHSSRTSPSSAQVAEILGDPVKSRTEYETDSRSQRILHAGDQAAIYVVIEIPCGVAALDKARKSMSREPPIVVRLQLRSSRGPMPSPVSMGRAFQERQGSLGRQ